MLLLFYADYAPGICHCKDIVKIVKTDAQCVSCDAGSRRGRGHDSARGYSRHARLIIADCHSQESTPFTMALAALSGVWERLSHCLWSL